MEKIQKILFWTINGLFAFFIYFLSLRPLSPAEEKLKIIYSKKSFIEFVIECLFIQSLFAVLFATIIYFLFKKLLSGEIKRNPFLKLLFCYIIFSMLCGIEYFMYINSLVY